MRAANVFAGAALCVGIALSTAVGAQTPRATKTDTFNVRISIEGVCIITSSADINFGIQTAGAGTHDETGQIKVQCSKDTDFTLGLDGGTTTGDVNARAMANGTARVPYVLSQNASMTPIWGNDETSWYSGTGQGIGAAYEISLPVYARATLTGNEPPGSYLDTVTATLTY